MTTRRALRVASAVLAGWSLLLTLVRPAFSADYVVVVNASNSITSISRAELKKTITGVTKQWKNGAVVQLGLIPKDAPETQYLASLLDVSTRELIGRIQEQVFKGEMRRPVVLKSSQDCLALARASQGAICIATAGSVLPAEARVVPVE